MSTPDDDIPFGAAATLPAPPVHQCGRCGHRMDEHAGPNGPYCRVLACECFAWCDKSPERLAMELGALRALALEPCAHPVANVRRVGSVEWCQCCGSIRAQEKWLSPLGSAQHREWMDQQVLSMLAQLKKALELARGLSK